MRWHIQSWFAFPQLDTFLWRTTLEQLVLVLGLNPAVGSVINGDFMKILVTGGTGTVGKEVVKALLRRGASVRVLTRNKEAKRPDGAEVAIGDLSDPVSVAEAIKGVDELFC